MHNFHRPPQSSHRQNRTPGPYSRRRFLSRALALGAALALPFWAGSSQAQSSHSGENHTGGGKRPRAGVRRRTRLTPPGSRSQSNFRQRCNGCQLCVANCPNHVLQAQQNLESLAQPEMNFSNGWCRPGCTSCSRICPNGAILPLTREQKSSLQIGIARHDPSLCLRSTQGIPCQSCLTHCPNGAISLRESTSPAPGALSIPLVNVTRCLGCGACEHMCPASPLPAIHVEGLAEHRTL